MEGGNLPDDALQYLKEQRIPDLMEGILHELMVNTPEDPISFLIDTLSRPDPLRVIIVGAPASGKGTVCENLVRQFGLVHVSTGDLLRQEVRNGTKLGKEAEPYLKKGELVPDAVVLPLVTDRLAQNDARSKGWLLDGVPRTRNQALSLQQAGHLPQRLILLECSDATVIDRVEGRRTDPVTGSVYHVRLNPAKDPAVAARLEQRPDDTRDAALTRLREFHNHIREILPCYESVQARVDGEKPPAAVWEQVKALFN
eukprot:TRINITY_DN481_c0_g1_i1.p2 TRINITY_DN481_c0_g1~~TRINITY_DN481_c0_g1_i1.p2  ORF type:complete len:256 (+),score=63.16 TRINITY_DN481_c0_g1_i1:149-916(+)